jgi:TonB family protein
MLVCLVLLLSLAAMAQDVAQSTPQPAVIRELSPPTYPPLARAARISGPVEVDLILRKDGEIESASVVSGHPMLKDTALESARKSKYDCAECTEELSTRRIIYNFELGEAVDCKLVPLPENSPLTGSYPCLRQSGNTVTLIVTPFIISDPAVYLTWRVRSIECLYLWKCRTKNSQDRHE